MNLNPHSFKSHAVRPGACLREGWQLVKNDYWLFFGITLLGLLFGGLAALFLMGPVMCGIHYCYFRLERGQRVSIDMLFRGFDYFVPSLIATIVMFVPVMLFTLLANGGLLIGIFGTIAAMMPKPGDPQEFDPNILWIIGGLVAAYVGSVVSISVLLKLFFFFTYPLIVDRSLSGVDAVKLSARAVMSNLFGVIGVMILIELIGVLGMFLCFVGAYLTLPLTFAMVSIAYQQVFAREFPPPEPDEEREPAAAMPAETGIKGESVVPSAAPDTGVTEQK